MEVLTRSVYPVSYNARKIERLLEDDEEECGFCSGNERKEADFMIIKGTSKPFPCYICMNCLEEEVQTWIEEQLETLKQELPRYKVAGKL